MSKGNIEGNIERKSGGEGSEGKGKRTRDALRAKFEADTSKIDFSSDSSDESSHSRKVPEPGRQQRGKETAPPTFDMKTSRMFFFEELDPSVVAAAKERIERFLPSSSGKSPFVPLTESDNRTVVDLQKKVKGLFPPPGERPVSYQSNVTKSVASYGTGERPVSNQMVDIGDATFIMQSPNETRIEGITPDSFRDRNSQILYNTLYKMGKDEKDVSALMVGFTRKDPDKPGNIIAKLDGNIARERGLVNESDNNSKEAMVDYSLPEKDYWRIHNDFVAKREFVGRTNMQEGWNTGW